MPHACDIVELPRQALRSERPVRVRLVDDWRSRSGTASRARIERFLTDHRRGDLLVAVGFASPAGLGVQHPRRCRLDRTLIEVLVVETHPHLRTRSAALL